jgi:hypothetical protein
MMRPLLALQAALLCIAILSGTSPVNGQARLVITDNYEKYSPGDLVERYKHDPDIINRMVSGKDANGQPVNAGQEWQAYFLAMSGVICLCACGFILCCGFCCWNCFTCSTPMDRPGTCVPPAACATKQAKMCQLGTAGLLGLLLLIFSIVGFVYTSKDDTAVRNLPNILGEIAGRFDYISGEINHFESLYNSSTGNRTTLFTAINSSNFNNQTAKDSVVASMVAATDASAIISDTVLQGTGSTKEIFSDLADDLRKLQADANEGLGSVQDGRNDANITILLFIMFAGCCAVLAVAAPSVKKSFREMSNVYCLSSCFVICMLLFTMMLAAVYLFITTLVADVCYDPKGWMVQAMNVPDDASTRSPEQNMSSYYIECGGYDALRRENAWPLSADLTNVSSACADIGSSTTAITIELTSVPTVNLTSEIDKSVQADTEMCEAVYGADEGILGWNGLLKCAVINQLYEQVLFDICEDVFSPIALMYEMFVCLAVILIFAEIVQKFARRMEDKDGVNKYGQDGQVAPGVDGYQELGAPPAYPSQGQAGSPETANPTFEEPSSAYHDSNLTSPA